MHRSKIISIISFFLIVVIITPTVIRVLNDNDQSIVGLELNEDENKKENKKKGENESDEEEPILNYAVIPFSTLFKEKSTISTSYMLIQYICNTDVILPPPKKHFG